MSTLTSVNGKGAVGSRPGFGIAGQLYYATDVLGGTLQRDTGSAWENLVSGQMAQIGKSTLVGSLASITLSGIPSGFTALMLMFDLRGDTGAASTTVMAQINGDTGANYDYQLVFADASSTSYAEQFAQVSAQLGYAAASTATAGATGQGTAWIFNYAATTFHKTIRSEWGMKRGTTTTNLFTGDASAYWRSTAAVTSLTLLPGAGNFIAGSTAILYGLV